MKSLFLYLLLFTLSYANECHQTLVFDDVHHLDVSMDGHPQSEKKIVKETLYMNHVEEGKKKYTIFWYGNPKTKKNEIDVESINAPFVVGYDDTNTSYSLEKLSMLSKDKEIEKALWAKINILQFASKDGVHHFKNGKGYIEAEQEFNKSTYTLHRLRSFENGKKKKGVKFEQSTATMQLLDKTCGIWKSIDLNETITSEAKMLKLFLKDNRELKIQNVKNFLPKDHWFYQLSADTKTWNIKTQDDKMSLSMAQSMYKKNEQEMKDALADTKVFEKWVKDHMGFLKHLSLLLENNTLNDKVSMKLYATLSFIDSVESTKILGEVALNENIIEKERFRGVMGLADTTAPLDDDVMAEVLDYGLESDNSPDTTIQNMLGMVSGGLAKARMQRSPDQAETIVTAIIDTINTKDNKIVSLAAAGNLQEMAPPRLVEAVDNTLLSTGDTNTRIESAEALSKLEKSTLSTQKFEMLIAKESNSMAKTALINASASSTDFKNNPKFNATLLDIAKTTGYSKNKIAAIETLGKSSYATSKEEKAVIRQMMIGEHDSQTLQALKKLYRK